MSGKQKGVSTSLYQRPDQKFSKERKYGGMMTREGVFQKLDEVFQDVFDDPSIHVEETTTAADIEDWDSLEHINLIVAVEDTFGIKFTMGEVTHMEQVGDMADLIMKKLGLTS